MRTVFLVAAVIVDNLRGADQKFVGASTRVLIPRDDTSCKLGPTESVTCASSVLEAEVAGEARLVHPQYGLLNTLFRRLESVVPVSRSCQSVVGWLVQLNKKEIVTRCHHVGEGGITSTDEAS